MSPSVLADAVADLLKRVHQGTSGSDGKGAERLSRRDRRVAARTKTSPPAASVQPEPAPEGHSEDPDRVGDDDPHPGEVAKVIPLPISDPFAEADKRW